MTVNRDQILLLEPSSGISGDMFIASLIDLGLDRNWLSETIGEVLPGDNYVKIERGTRGGISGTRFRVMTSGELSHRSIYDIKSLIEGSALADEIKSRAIETFQLLADVESNIHGVGVEEVHFHEVGAIDSIADVIGSVAGIRKLNPEAVYSTPVNTGSGFVTTEHGKLPVPAPATAELLRRCGALTYSEGIGMELTTPTGAAILATFVDEFTRPPMRFESIGYGLGSKKIDGAGNFLRATLGSISPADVDNARESEVVIETNIDDMNPELFPVVENKLLDAGALEVFKTPIQMKKNRPGVKLTLICSKEKVKTLSEIIFRETTTIGLRTHEVDRAKLDRKKTSVRTEFGPVEIKVGYLEGEPVNYSPEFESCKTIADELGVPVKDVYSAAMAKARSMIE